VGIDFGTSTTVVSIASCQGNIENIKSTHIELNQKLDDGGIYKSYKIPTMIAWFNESLLVGEGANRIKLKLKQGKNLWHSFKMELGEDVGCKYPESELNSDRLKLLNPKDAARIFFKYLKIQIEKYVKDNNLPLKVEYAVSIPASFEANQRKDLLDSLHANSMMMHKQALIDEPNAAFLSYVSSPKMKSEILISEEYPTNILVFDFGAGTCDISILEVANSSKGFYSKNLSISRFEALGGNDIDKSIALDILLPQFLSENNIEKSFFKSKELLQYILPRLEKPAELLKIKISEQIELLKDENKINELINSKQSIEVNHIVEIKSRKGIFRLHRPALSYRQFYEMSEKYTDVNIKDSGDKGEQKSIFSPIFSAIEKANLEKDEIDYVLFIGGSAKNPFIQKALKKYFNEAEHLIPENLQVHVSAGAAIHSLMYNGLGKNLIDPITSEPIMIITKEGEREELKIILKAGTVIPCDAVVINDLKPQKNGQMTIEMPICVGNENKILHNIKVESLTEKGFSSKSKIELIISINADKMLIIEATVDGKKIEIEPLNPFSNKESTVKDRQVFEFEKEYNKSLSLNHGKETQNMLEKLYDAYESLGLELKAAETLEELYEKYSFGNLNNIGLHFSHAGDKEKAMIYYLKFMDEKPSSVAAFNIALEYRYGDKKLYSQWLKKSLEIDPNYNASLYCLGLIFIDEGEESKGQKMIKKAFDSWRIEYENNDLSSHISWFIACAKYLGENKLVMELRKKEDADAVNSKAYESENLTSVQKTNQGG
jgi:molecular chaperone DnaK (HSP70)